MVTNVDVVESVYDITPVETMETSTVILAPTPGPNPENFSDASLATNPSTIQHEAATGNIAENLDDETLKFADPEPPHPKQVLSDEKENESLVELTVRKRKRDEILDVSANEHVERTSHVFHAAECSINKDDDDRMEESDENMDISDSEDEEGEIIEEDETDECVTELDEVRFFSTLSFTPNEMLAIKPVVCEGITKCLLVLEEQGFEAFEKHLRERETKKLKSKKTQLERTQQALQDCTVQGDPREYQRVLFEIAKSKNTIVNLGTGFGKTLIALLCIRHFSPSLEEGKQTLFMVPSVALAVQQSMTLRANLPNFTVQTACYASSNTENSRQALAKCNVIVATHGAIHDLLMHYGDLFGMKRFNLIVIDECHYATGNHAYAVVMKKFYHSTPKEERPHILGLTASPLVNVKETHSDEQLSKMLGALEGILDSTLVSISGLVSEDSFSGLLHKSAEEHVVPYIGTNIGRSIPSADNLPLHQSRFREFRQLLEVYQNLGPLVVSIYCRTLARELSRNAYEKESIRQFDRAVKHLVDIAVFCEQECVSMKFDGRTDKLLALEELLEDQIEEHGGAKTVGLVFVERRITAMALHNYFLHRNDKLEKGEWTRARNIRKNVKPFSAPKSQFHANLGNGGQFDDAFDDPSSKVQKIHESQSVVANATPSYAHEFKSHCNTMDDQFMDAEEDDEAFKSAGMESFCDPQMEDADEGHLGGSCAGEEKENIKDSIRTAVLVRNSTQIFKSLCIGRKIDKEDEAEYKTSWLHQETRIRDVLNKLRHGEINILIATSVVEEGVDVQACSFVAVFDTLKNTKGYIQMKGRARQKNAKFFVFQGINMELKSSLSLSLAQRMERRVHRFIETQSKRSVVPPESLRLLANGGKRLELEDGEVVSKEFIAVEDNFYSVKHGFVDLESAKSLLNRYTLSVPLDPFARSSKESLLAHMPVYDSEQLILPSHIPHNVRLVRLPPKYYDQPKKQRHKMMALMACVRLHTYGLLNDRLLPLTRRDMQNHIMRVATKELQTVSLTRPPVEKAFTGEVTEIFVYAIRQTSPDLSRYHSIFRGKGHALGLVTFDRIGIEVPDFNLKHSEFGIVSNSLGPELATTCTAQERTILSQIFVLLLNERWRRRTRNMRFKMREHKEYKSVVAPYLAGILAKDGQLDWDEMKLLISDSMRSKEERTDCVRSASDKEKLPAPRLWAPLYDPHISYIVYGPSGETCSADFPHDREGITTYHDYFCKHRGFEVDKDSPLFDVQRVWNLPSNLPLVHSSAESYTHNPNIKTKEARYEVCKELASVKLAREACFEPPLANTDISLLSTLLPQFLFFFERCLVAKAFIDHCKMHIPTLGENVAKLPVGKLFTALTAKSCSLDDCYDKLEWFGDAALKLIQTDALLKSVELRQWIRFLHEGDLSTLRSAMGSNDRLEQTCRHLRLDKFIMTAPLARGQWIPACIDFTEGTEMKWEEPSGGKIFADLIESILGLIYLEYGYMESMRVADELKVTLPWDNYTERQTDHEFNNKEVLNAVRRCTGYGPFNQPELVEEAFTHPSALHPTVPSYQRLEWVGDAVLCLAAREWIFKNFPDIPLGDMVVMESAMVANETLAFLSMKNRLQHHLNHRDHSLPSRIESYDWSIRELGRGLWGADPPKSISDIVEAILGAVHVDGGFSNGQKAALTLLLPILNVLLGARNRDKILHVKHPKKIIQEMGGELLELASTTESEFAMSREGTKVWFGKQWSEADRQGNSYISSIELLGRTVLAVSDPSALVARNRACALIVAVLEEDSELLERLQASRVKVECGVSNAVNKALLEGFEATKTDEGDVM